MKTMNELINSKGRTCECRSCVSGRAIERISKLLPEQESKELETIYECMLEEIAISEMEIASLEGWKEKTAKDCVESSRKVAMEFLERTKPATS